LKDLNRKGKNKQMPQNYYHKTPLEYMLGQDEKIFYKGKPDKLCFFLESIFNPLLPFALIWGLIDFSIIGAAIFTSLISGTGDFGDFGGMGILALTGFFALHLMPVWIYLGGVLFTARKYKNTEYIITDRGVYISGGVFTYNCEMKPFTDLAHVNVHRGIFDQMLGVGDVVMICGHQGYNSRGTHSSGGFTICDIRNFMWVFKLIKDLQTDIYSDTMYPNDLRPKENHGYNTRYSKDFNDG